MKSVKRFGTRLFACGVLAAAMMMAVPAAYVMAADAKAAAPAALPAEYANMPETVSSFGAVADSGWLYVYGGHKGTRHEYNNQTASNSFNRLNLADGKTWEKLPGGPPMQGMNLAAYDGKIYRVGGMQPKNKPGDNQDLISIVDVARYNPATNSWEPLPSLPEPRSSHDVAFIGSKAYVVGGWNMKGVGSKNTWPKEMLVMDVADANPSWKPLAQPFQRRAFMVTAFNGKLYALGGLSMEGDTELEVQVYDPLTDTWALGPEIPGGGSNGFSCSACVLEGKLYMNVGDGSTYKLDDAGKKWEKVGITPGRIVARMVPNGKTQLLVVGGSFGKGVNRNTIDVVDLSKPYVEAKTADVGEMTQKFCPVMTGEEIDKDSTVLDYKGKKVALCCDNCVAKFEKDPDNYANVKILPQLAGLEIPKRMIEQVYCPVNKENVISAKDVSVEFKGKTIYLFDKAAKRKWDADPEKYADAKILPQLADVKDLPKVETKAAAH
jgi:N-acetylneuraminic acid mutarotase/YHS domain-containing protein